MRNLFLPGADFVHPTLTIEGPDAHHLTTVLRIRVGERLRLLDDAGTAVEAEVAEVAKRSIEVRVVGPAAVAPEPAVCITVAQALGKGDKFEQVIQHGTETGASAFIPLLTERAVVKLDLSSSQDKCDRWRQIAKGAAEQSGRARIPAVYRPRPFRELADELRNDKPYDRALLLHPGGRPLESALGAPLPCRLDSSHRPPEVLVIVGPEGGFSKAEVETAESAGVMAVSLGDYVLRTETAALAAIVQVLFAVRILNLNPHSK